MDTQERPRAEEPSERRGWTCWCGLLVVLMLLAVLVFGCVVVYILATHVS